MLRSPATFVFITSLILLLSQFWTSSAYRKVNQQLIDTINSMNLSWQAGAHPTDIPATFSRRFKRTSVSKQKFTLKNKNMPQDFDARRKFDYCSQVLHRIRNQGDCLSSWAVAAASLATDRTCIELKKSVNSYNTHLSSEDLATCCEKCRDADPCAGGDETRALQYWVRNGIVSGGEVGTQEGCKPYSKEMMQGKNVSCKKECTNKRYSKSYRNDIRKGGFVYKVDKDEEKIQLEIYYHGPVLATIVAYEDFIVYKKGVYRHKVGVEEGLHVIKIIGWGVRKGEKYWLVANSYGEDWGEKGFMKFLRGENDCKIEEEVVAATLFVNPWTRERRLSSVDAPGLNAGFLHFILFVLKIIL